MAKLKLEDEFVPYTTEEFEKSEEDHSIITEVQRAMVIIRRQEATIAALQEAMSKHKHFEDGTAGESY